MLLQFIHTLHTDWIKYRKSLVPWASLAYVLLVTFLVFIFTIGDKRNPDNAVFQFARNITSVGAFFLPFYLVLIISLLGFIEHRNQGWKLMYTQPVGRGYFYISKLVMLMLLILIVFILKFIFSSIAVKLIELFKHQIKLTDFLKLVPDFLLPELKIIVSCSALIAIQYWLSIRLKNFLLSSGIGTIAIMLPLAVFMILGIAGLIATPDKLGNFLKLDPYSLPYSFIFDFSQMKSNTTLVQIPSKFVLGSLLAGILIFTAGFFDIRRRNIH